MRVPIFITYLTIGRAIPASRLVIASYGRLVEPATLSTAAVINRHTRACEGAVDYAVTYIDDVVDAWDAAVWRQVCKLVARDALVTGVEIRRIAGRTARLAYKLTCVSLPEEAFIALTRAFDQFRMSTLRVAPTCQAITRTWPTARLAVWTAYLRAGFVICAALYT